jgi:LPS sulfotransferase NodH
MASCTDGSGGLDDRSCSKAPPDRPDDRRTAAAPQPVLIGDPEAAEARASPRSRAFVICTAPRTGSSLLSDALSKSGVAGRPAEYFDIYAHNQQYWARALGIERAEHYFDRVIHAGTTPNGVFGLKIHWHQLPALFAAFRHAPLTGAAGGPAKTLDECLQTRFASTHYLWLRRRNKVAQGISYYRAAKSSIWRVASDAGAGQIAEPPPFAFDFDQIDHHVRLCEQFDRYWHAYFVRQKLKAMVLIYEDFIQSYEKTLRSVCDYIGVGGQGIVVPPPGYRRQADSVSKEWEREYRRLKGVSAAAPATPQIRLLKTPKRTLPADPESKISGAVSAPAVTAPGSPEATAIIAYHLNSNLEIKIASASPRRAWMDAIPQRFAYRCLPLVIANQYGWLLLSPCRIEAVWTGEASLASLKIAASDAKLGNVAVSHFGSGILTFSTGYLFRTPPGVNLYVRGPANWPKDGISALEGIVETDWAEATFTMNWQMTRPNHPVAFEEGEPFAMISPVPRGDIERFRPEIRSIADNPPLDEGYRNWATSRSIFNRDLRIKDSWAQKSGWQRHYVHGETLSNKSAEDHQTSLSVRPFTDKRSKGRPGS